MNLAITPVGQNYIQNSKAKGNVPSFGALVFNDVNIQKYDAFLLKGEVQKVSFDFEERILLW